MERTLLYLSPQFPRNFSNFVLRLHEAGVRVLALGSDYFGQLSPELQRSITEYYRVAWMEDYPQVLEAGRYFKQKYGAIDRVESHVEYWLPTDGALREDLNIWGKKRTETAMVRQKSLMKTCFRSAGIPTAEGRLANSIDEVRGFIDQVGYPIIAKPDAGVGAGGTYRIDGQEALERFFQQKGDTAYFFEQFVAGEIVTFDGLTDIDGRVVYSNSLRFPSGVMETVNSDDHLCYWTLRRLDPRLEELGHRAVRAFDIRERFFHVEFFLPQPYRKVLPTEYVAIEMNARPPGGLTVDMWNYADDIDLYSGWAGLIAGSGFSALWSRQNHVVYLGRKDRFNYQHSHEEVMRFLGSRLMHWERMPSLFQPVMGDTAYLARVSSLGEVEEVQKMVQARW